MLEQGTLPHYLLPVFQGCLLASAYTIPLEPVNVTKLLGSEAQFKATVEGLWPMMFWQVGEITVLSISSSGEVINSFPQHSARLCGNGSSCVEFTIQNLTRQDSGPVTCTVQGDYGFKTSQLIVQGNNISNEEQVEFQCEVVGWFPAATISWTLNGYAVNSSLVNTTDVPDGDKYNSTSVIKFQAVRNTTVTCVATIPALTGPISSSVQLAVSKIVLCLCSCFTYLSALQPASLESTHAGNGFNAAYVNLEVGFPKKHRHVTIV
uniref:Ig-like domain-containing protein n=1 Tax=Periophthalmus magnuspinnatus TaxID=409849 RepID=A0A3B3ZXZ7_9GOBI